MKEGRKIMQKRTFHKVTDLQYGNLESSTNEAEAEKWEEEENKIKACLFQLFLIILFVLLFLGCIANIYYCHSYVIPCNGTFFGSRKLIFFHFIYVPFFSLLHKNGEVLLLLLLLS
jgi:hypothetical protein